MKKLRDSFKISLIGSQHAKTKCKNKLFKCCKYHHTCRQNNILLDVFKVCKLQKRAEQFMELLNVLRRAGVCKTIILKVTTIRPVLEYTLPVWQSISDYLADVIESVSVKMGNYFSLWRNRIRRPWVKQTTADSAGEKRY